MKFFTSGAGEEWAGGGIFNEDNWGGVTLLDLLLLLSTPSSVDDPSSSSDIRALLLPVKNKYQF